MLNIVDNADTKTPTVHVDTQAVFGVDVPFDVHAFETGGEFVPALDESYHFNPDVTRALLAGFAHNRRVMVQGFHGTGKSTHIEQIAARLNWPCLRINLDSHISRTDLLGKDAIIVRNGKQVTEYKEGLLPWALQNPVALVFDEYDAGRADVMFVIQRVLEAEGRLTMLEQNRVITAHPSFRLFATANTIGLGDTSGLYHGTQQINQGQMDRWNMVVALNYLSPNDEMEILMAKCPELDRDEGGTMIALANMTRTGFMAGDLSTLMSPRTLISWAENAKLLGDRELAFKLSFLNRSDEMEHPIIAEYYQRCFDITLIPAAEHATDG